MLIRNGTILTPEKQITDRVIEIENGKIKAIVAEDEVNSTEHEIIDANNGYILPGLIDIHTHGGAGSDVMDSDYQAFVNIAKFHASHGVTSIVATTLASPEDEIIKCLQEISKVVNKDLGGSNILGAHLEGPFLSYKNKGAHPAEFLQEPNKKLYNIILRYAEIIKTITIAPELPGAIELIEKAAKLGITVSGGHDDAIDIEILHAIEQGLKHTTHIYCVMSSISKRNNHKHLGLTELALMDERLTTEIIADNKHLSPLMVKWVFQCKGAHKLCLVSDCLKIAGLPKSNKEYMIGPKSAQESFKVVVDDGVAMLPDRSLNAGSITTLDQMIRNLVNDCEISLVDAVRMASTTPAEIIGIDRKKGSIGVGKDADISIFDQQLFANKTIVEGKLVYENDRGSNVNGKRL